MKYILYARKSSESEDRQMSSNEDQVIEMQRVAAELNITVVDIISEAKSAKRPGRTGFNQMLRRIENGDAQGILCWKLNRLARNPVDGGQISWLLQQRVIKHIQTYGRAYTPDDNVLMMQVEFGMANQFIKDLKVDVERGIKRKIERGWFPTKPPAGYLPVNRSQRNHYDPEIICHPTQFSIVKNLWNLLLSKKYTVVEIKRIGDSLGLQKKNGQVYSIKTYYKMFSNVFYTGYFYWKSTNGIIEKYKGKHTPMISLAEFELAQRILHNRIDRRDHIHDFPYRGIIKCGECRGNVVAERKKQAICTSCKLKFSIISRFQCPRCQTRLERMDNPTILDKVYYHCSKKTTPTCTQKSILKDQIDKLVSLHIRSISISQEFYEWGLAAMRLIEANTEEHPSIGGLRKRRTELNTRLSGLIKMRADGEVSKEQFESLTSETGYEMKSIEKILNTQKSLSEMVEIAIKSLFDFTLECENQFKNGDSRTHSLILSTIGSNLTLFEKNLKFTRDKLYSCVKDCETKYYAEKPRVEPKKTVGNKRQISHFDPLFLLLCAQLQNIRTCLEGKILEELENEAKGILPDPHRPLFHKPWGFPDNTACQ